MPKPTFGSLFAGIGGFDLGFERAGFKCKWQVEIDDYATKVLEKHWPKVHRERDIRQCGSSNLERVDCIIGGFPCQDISYAGRGAGLAGERSGLFFEAVRMVRELQPRAVVLENVAALLTRGLDRVLGTLAEIGYDAQWHCIPAASVGAPHIRDRVFVLAYSASVRNCKREKPFGGTHETRKSGAKWTVEPCGFSRKENVADAAGIRFKRERAAEQQVSYARSPKGQLEGVRSARGAIHWATEPAVGRVANGIPSRVDRLRCLGNAIVPQVAEVVARMTKQQLDW